MTTSFSASLWDSPRVFVSYRWGEDDAWVSEFVSKIHRCGISVIYDKWAQSKWDWSDTDELLDKLFIAMEQCHAFIPIFTPSYLRRAGFMDGGLEPGSHTDDGIVYDEFQKSIVLSQFNQIETIAVLLSGSSRLLPPPFHLGNILDMRDPSKYDSELERLVGYLHGHRVIPDKGSPVQRQGIIDKHGIQFFDE